MQGLGGRSRLQLDPSKDKSEKRESETNRDRPDGAEKPFIGNTTRDLRNCEFVHTDAQRHRNN